MAGKFRRWMNRLFIVCGVSAMAIAMQLGIHGAIAGRYLRNIHWSRLQAWLCLTTAAICLPAALAIFFMKTFVPSVASSIDAFLPMSVFPEPMGRRRKRRDSDADAEVLEQAVLQSQQETHAALASTVGRTLASAALGLQTPDMADNILTGTYTSLWHAAMAGPATVWVFDTGLRGEPRMVFQGLVAVAGIVLAAASLRLVATSGIWVGERGRQGVGSRGGLGGAVVERATVQAVKEGLRRTSTLSMLALPFLLHGLVALCFLWLHVDRGGHIHWHPFDPKELQ